MKSALEISDVSVEPPGAHPLLSFAITAGYPGRPDVLRNATFEMGSGEILGLVGRSGEGKSTIAMAILKLLDIKGGAMRGEICFQGVDLASLSERGMRRIRGREIALIPQSPVASLNPALTIGAQFREAWNAHQDAPFAEFEPRLMDLLASVSLPAEKSFLHRRPGHLSVGQAQRVLIAMALVHRPPLVIADESTSALDMITQAEILELLARLNRELGMAILYISHDLLSVGALCGRVAILHDAEIVECRPTREIFLDPRHPYTRQLIAAIPRNSF
jgi:ABC-type dipeptide/oligopeptide/nickel transport system ATPase component